MASLPINPPKIVKVQQPTTYPLVYEFHPMGQGLFASGFVQFGKKPEDRFNWVYDCGTSTSVIKTISKNSVAKYLNAFRPKLAPKPNLDLLTISHFDGDHTSGIPDLLSLIHVKTLMLPYIVLWRRIALAFSAGNSISSFAMNLSVNPIEALLAGNSDGIDRIVFVTDEESVDTELETISLDDESELADAEGSINSSIEDNEDIDALKEAARSANSMIAFVPNAISLLAHSTWEFVPYNDAAFLHLVSKKFIAAVSKSASKLLSGAGKIREDALLDLKKIYDDQFGATSILRNRISLFLYGGPVSDSNYATLSGQSESSLNVVKGLEGRLGVMKSDVEEGAILYTGDGFLNDTKRLGELTKFLTKARFERVGVLQVPHHGASKNSCTAVATEVSPSVSVFSSDPDRKKPGHPHASALKSFWNCGPVQVDLQHALRVYAQLVIP